MSSTQQKSVVEVIHPARFVTVELAAKAIGLTRKAIERKIEDGKWAEGLHYRRAPDGRIYIDLKGFEQWVGTATASN